MADVDSKGITTTPGKCSQEPPDVTITLTQHGRQQIEGIVSRNRQEPKRQPMAKGFQGWLAEHLYNEVTRLLDAEPESDAETTARIAQAVQKAFETAYRAEQESEVA